MLRAQRFPGTGALGAVGWWARVARWGAAALLACLPLSAQAQTIGAGPTRFVDFLALADHDDQADISVQFNCSLRYITHSPSAEGKELRVQLQPTPNCNVEFGAQIAGELPAVMGGTGIIDSARVESDVPGQVTLVLAFRKSERFVLVQGVDIRSLRVRLFDRARGRGKVLVGEQVDNVANYAVNLDSQPKKIEPAQIALAEQRLKVQIFTSEASVDGNTWYRLRAGPFDKRADAERVLNAALPDYPRAWLAIGDEANAVPSGDDGPLPPVERIGADAPMEPELLKKTLGDARSALSARDYTKAVTLLTRLQRQPEFEGRAQTQELLGLARERSGQLAHAKAEYEEYLRRYPKGDAAERVARRLRTLRAASLNARGGTGGGGNGNAGWDLSGGFGQMFRFDGTRVDNTASPGAPSTIPTSGQATRQNALFTDVDVLARRHGERFDFAARVSTGYSRNFADKVNGDQKRVTVASVELADRNLGLLARLGRQSRNDDGVLGLFDGLFVSYQFHRMFTFNTAAGYPVERTQQGLQSRRRFSTFSMAITPPGAHWDASVFSANQTFEGYKDRQAIGFEARYLASRLSLTALTDYDTLWHSLNAAALLGSLQLPKRWSLSWDAERRNTPVIAFRNSLIGLQFTSIADAINPDTGGGFTLDQLHQYAIDRTAISSNYSLTVTRPIGARFQFAATGSVSSIGGTADSESVQGTPPTGTILSFQTQLYASNLWRTGDFNVLSLAYNNTDVATDYSLGWTSRIPLGGGAWRLGPRLTIDHRTLVLDHSNENTLLPSLLLDYQKGRKLLQFEAGGSVGKRDALQQSQRLTRDYISLSYRIGF